MLAENMIKKAKETFVQFLDKFSKECLETEDNLAKRNNNNLNF